MAVAKLSISLDAELVEKVRAAADDEGTSVSAWLADAAEVKARQRLLREALDTDAPEVAQMSDEELAREIAKARMDSVLVTPAGSFPLHSSRREAA